MSKQGRGTAPQAPAAPVRQQGMGPIQVVPPGLMGLLQLKQTGKLPGTLSETVVPVIELRDWYLTARRVDELALFGAILNRTFVTGNQGVATLRVAIAGTPVPTVPENEIWYVEEYSIFGPTAAAADVLVMAPAISNPTNVCFQILGAMSTDVVSARQRFITARADRGFWAFPGDQFAVAIEDISTAGILVQGSLRATRCPI